MPHKVSELNDFYPTDCPVLLAVRSEHANWIWLPSDLYIRYYDGSKAKVYEHRLVAERAFRDTPDGWHVHHLDENKKHNSASNLQPMANTHHQRIHKGYQQDLLLACPICGKWFLCDPQRNKRRNINYCSQECAHVSQQRTRKPTKDELIGLMQTIGNWCKIGAMFSVSNVAARKWAISYQIDPKLCDGRRTRAGDR